MGVAGIGAKGSMESALLSEEKCERDLPRAGGESSTDGELNALGNSGSDLSSSSTTRDRRLSVRKPNTWDARCGVLGSCMAYGLLREGRGGVSTISLSSTSSEEMAGFSEERSCSANESSGSRGVAGKWESVSGVGSPREEVDDRDAILSVSLKKETKVQTESETFQENKCLPQKTLCPRNISL
jgi:hypothetical protein